MERLFQALLDAETIMNDISNKINKVNAPIIVKSNLHSTYSLHFSKGYIVQKKTKKVKIEKSMAIEDEEVLT
jgi:hypothetical protein